jgi:hypothetical protein
MLIDTVQLRSYILDVAASRFGQEEFRRRMLMDEVESHLWCLKVWTAEDDEPSRSAGKKSKGQAWIDWGISKLKMEARLLNTSRGRWRLPPV